jgi:hypothetical protein
MIRTSSSPIVCRLGACGLAAESIASESASLRFSEPEGLGAMLPSRVSESHCMDAAWVRINSRSCGGLFVVVAFALQCSVAAFWRVRVLRVDPRNKSQNV